MKPEDVIKDFDKKFPFAIIDWKLGQENDGDGISTDKMKEIKSHFISTIISIYKEELKEIEEMAKEAGMQPHFPGGQTEFRKRFRIEALSDLRTKLESKIKEWELLGNK
jgi:hypothetical protein